VTTAAGARRLAGRACGAGALLVLLGVLLWGARDPYPVTREIAWMRGTGYLAFGALCLALSASPLGRAFELASGSRARRPLVAAFRRALGITAACAGMLHASVALSTHLVDAWPSVLEVPFLRSGALALGVLAVLLVTSFPRVVRALRIGLWRELHWLAFPALALALHHLLLSPFAGRAFVLRVAVVLLAVGSLRLLPRGRLRA
jgi:sulfoxide reductase heme-binding subunit YedZ